MSFFSQSGPTTSSHSTTHEQEMFSLRNPAAFGLVWTFFFRIRFLFFCWRPEDPRVREDFRPWFLWGPKNQGNLKNLGPQSWGSFSIGILFTRVPTGDPWVRDRFTIVIVSWLIYNLRDENNLLYLYRGYNERSHLLSTMDIPVGVISGNPTIATVDGHRSRFIVWFQILSSLCGWLWRPKNCDWNVRNKCIIFWLLPKHWKAGGYWGLIGIPS